MPPARPPWLGLLAVAALAATLRWIIADIPLERDEGEYAYIAQRWLLGEVPYRDSFDQKPPGVFAAYFVFLNTIGSSPAAIHWGAQLYTFGTLALISATGARLFGRRAGLVAAALAAFMTADCCVLGNAANTETFMTLPLTAGFLLTLRAVERPGVGAAFAAGVCGTLAVMCKQVAAVNVVFHGLVLLSSLSRWRLAAAYIVGGVVALAPVVGYFAAVGALPEFWDCVVGHNLRYASRVPYADYPDWFLGTFLVVLRQWWPILAFAVVGIRADSDDDRQKVRLVIAWLGVSFAGVCVGGYFRDHYYIQTIPALAVLAGRGVVRRAGRRAPAAVAVVVAYGVAVAPWYYLYGSPSEKSWTVYGDNSFPETVAIADELRRRAATGDEVYVYGSEPQIAYLAGLKHASRYIFAYPLMTAFPDTAERQAAVIRELTTRPPRFVVMVNNECSFLSDPACPTLLGDELHRLLPADYRRVASVARRTTIVATPPQLDVAGGQPEFVVWERGDGR